MTLLYYNMITEFKHQYYKNSLGIEHLQGEEIQMQKLTLPDGGVDDTANLWGYIFKKGNKKYLIDSKEINPQKDLPIIANQTEKVAYRGQVYYYIRGFSSIKIRPEKKMTYKQLINKLTYFKHTNKKHQKLLMILATTQLISKANFRISTPPSFGKDSSILVSNYLFGGSSSIVSPTIPKLEFLANILEWLAINEVVDLTTDQWRNIEQFLLDVGDNKPEITKHSRSIGTVGETIKVDNFSLSLFYNDIDQYPDPYKYVDYIAKKAVLDRFPPLRLWGIIKQDFNDSKDLNPRQYVTENMEEYKNILHTFSYYKKNYITERHYYKQNVTYGRIPERWMTNINKLLVFIDLYSDNQEEYDEWCKIIKDSIEDYTEMWDYPKQYEKATKKYPNDSKDLNYSLSQKNTFKEKKELLSNFVKTGMSNLEQGGFW